MKRRATPGSLALIGVVALVLSLVVAFVGGVVGAEWRTVMLIAMALVVLGALILIGAAIAKVVQIGVRSANN